jgi:hypothetical protein
MRGAFSSTVGAASAHFLGPVELMTLDPGPNATAVALGGGSVATASASYAALHNPARLASAQGYGAGVSLGGRELLDVDFDAYYLSAFAPVAHLGTIGVSYQMLRMSDSLFSVDPLHPSGSVSYQPRATRMAVTAATSAWRGWSAGLQVGRLERDEYPQATDDSAWMLDLGVSGSWQPSILPVGRVETGLALFNATGAELGAVNGDLLGRPWSELPRSLQLGAAYGVGFGGGVGRPDPARATLSVQYRDVLNQRYHSRAQVGLELELSFRP